MVIGKSGIRVNWTMPAVVQTLIHHHKPSVTEQICTYHTIFYSFPLKKTAAVKRTVRAEKF